MIHVDGGCGCRGGLVSSTFSVASFLPRVASVSAGPKSLEESGSGGVS